MEFIDRELSEAVWQETLAEMTEVEIAEYYDRVAKAQKEAIGGDYYQKAFEDMWRILDGEKEGVAI